MTVQLNLSYSAAQNHAFFESQSLGRYRIFPKGRRVGFTRGAAHACIEWGLEGLAVLWGDTIAGNIRRYVERYFLPVLRQQGINHEWNVVEKTLKFPDTGGHIDFRSADNPENWEGFGYDRIVLNEAGIILQGENGRYLYQNAVLPMMLDNPESELVAVGVPKGRAGLYFELYKKAANGEPGYYTRTYSSYDNPWLSREAIQQLEADMRTIGGEALVEQEIYGKFMDAAAEGMAVIPADWLDAAVQRWQERTPPAGPPDRAALDVARGGADDTSLARAWGDYVAPLLSSPGTSTDTGGKAAAFALPHLGPTTLMMVDVIGVGSSAYDHLTGIRPSGTVVAFNGANSIDALDRTGQLGFANMRAYAYWMLREALDPDNNATLALPPDEELRQELLAQTFELTASGIRIRKKDEIKKVLGRSPDKADAVSMLFYKSPAATTHTATGQALATRAGLLAAARLKRRGR